MRQRTIGILQVLLSGFCFGFLGIFGKQAYAFGLSPGEFLALRFLLATILLGAYLFLQDRALLRIPFKDFGKCALLGILGYAVFSSCYFEALRGLSVSLTVLLLYTYPVLVTLGAWAFFGEKLGRLEFFALPIATLGLGCLVWGDIEVRSRLALLLGFASSLFYSLYILVSSRWLKGIPPLTTTLYIMLAAALALSIAHLRPGRFPLPSEAWTVAFGAAFLCSVLAMSLFLAGLQKLASAEVALLSTAEPVTGILLATLFWGERLTALQWIGGALVILGMLFVAGAKRGLEKDSLSTDP